VVSGIWCFHSSGYEENCLLGYNAVKSIESQSTFERKLSPPSSGLKNKPSKISAWKQVARRRYILPGTSVEFQLHGLISQKIVLFNGRTVGEGQGHGRSERYFILGAGRRESNMLLEGRQSLLLRPSENDSSYVKTLEWFDIVAWDQRCRISV
jgi:hypothetical protein